MSEIENPAPAVNAPTPDEPVDLLAALLASVERARERARDDAVAQVEGGGRRG